MPRHKYKKAKVRPDKVYNSHEVAKLINYLMIGGEKSVAEKVVYQALDELKKQGEDPLKIFHQAIGLFSMDIGEKNTLISIKIVFCQSNSSKYLTHL